MPLIKDRLEEALELFECELLDAAEYESIKRQLMAELVDVRPNQNDDDASSPPSLPPAGSEDEDDDEEEDDEALQARLRAVYAAFERCVVTVRRRHLVDLCFAANRDCTIAPGAEGPAKRAHDALSFADFVAFFAAQRGGGASSSSAYPETEAAMLKAVLLTRRWIQLFALDRYAPPSASGSDGEVCTARIALVVDGGGDAVRVKVSLRPNDDAPVAKTTRGPPPPRSRVELMLTLHAEASEDDVHEVLGALEVALAAAGGSGAKNPSSLPWPLDVAEVNARLATSATSGERCIALSFLLGRTYDPSVAIGAATRGVREATFELSSRARLDEIMAARGDGGDASLVSLLGGALTARVRWDPAFIRTLAQSAERTEASDWADALARSKANARVVATNDVAELARTTCLATLASIATVDRMGLEYSTRSVADALSMVRAAMGAFAPIVGSSGSAVETDGGGDGGEAEGSDIFAMSASELRALYHGGLGGLISVARNAARGYEGEDVVQRALGAALGDVATRTLRGIDSLVCTCEHATIELECSNLDIFAVLLPSEFDH